MSYDKNEEIINNLIKEASDSGVRMSAMSESDVRRAISSIDRNAAMQKLRSMGLGSLADKLKTISDKELIDMISKNPSLMKKINSFLK